MSEEVEIEEKLTLKSGGTRRDFGRGGGRRVGAGRGRKNGKRGVCWWWRKKMKKKTVNGSFHSSMEKQVDIFRV